MERLQQKRKDTPLLNSIPGMRNSARSCSRCHGMLIETYCISPYEGTAEFQIRAMKCLQCGDLFDDTILENRKRSEHHSLTH